MQRKRKSRIQDLVGLVNRVYPPGLAESWDNVGLQVGDPDAQVDKVLVCLDPGPQAFKAARQIGAQAILSHHPLIFRPLKSITPAEETGRAVFQAIRDKIAVLAAHTNLDRGMNGLNDWLAAALGLRDCIPLVGEEAGQLFKLVVFVPKDYESQVAEAIFSAGGGDIGNYDHCSFRTEGTGTFRGNEETNPFLGEPGITEQTAEVRLEIIVPRERIGKVLEKMEKAHPYEEVAFDLIPLANHRPGIGLGRIGRLSRPIRLDSFARRTKKILQASHVRLVGDPSRRIAKVAVCGGSGAGLVGEAVRQGADLLVTGDVKYHEARHAEEAGITLIDAGHFATERLMAHHLAAVMDQSARTAGLDMAFVALAEETDPFRPV